MVCHGHVEVQPGPNLDSGRLGGELGLVDVQFWLHSLKFGGTSLGFVYLLCFTINGFNGWVCRGLLRGYVRTRFLKINGSSPARPAGVLSRDGAGGDYGKFSKFVFFTLGWHLGLITAWKRTIVCSQAFWSFGILQFVICPCGLHSFMVSNQWLQCLVPP